MKLEINPDNLHHAYCIVGDIDASQKAVQSFLKKELHIDLAGNPDFGKRSYDTLSVDDARDLAILQEKKPVQSDKKIVLITANFITREAQNAMLKMFEEPKGSTYFFLLMPRLGLIDTLKSRMIMIEGDAPKTSSIDPKKFLTMNPGTRLQEVKGLLERIAEDEKSKIEGLAFINALELELKGQEGAMLSKQSAKLFEEIEKMRGYATDQGASLKMILEYLAIIVPSF
jgi:DNA polymerase III delta prime subunit